MKARLQQSVYTDSGAGAVGYKKKEVLNLMYG
jgi:hypothetical protein